MSTSDDDSDGGLAANEYLMEKILKKRYVRGRPQYLVKWLGFSRRCATWEPVGNIYNYEFIRQFEREAAAERRARSAAAAEAVYRSILAQESGSDSSTSDQAPARAVTPRTNRVVAQPSRWTIWRLIWLGLRIVIFAIMFWATLEMVYDWLLMRNAPVRGPRRVQPWQEWPPRTFDESSFKTDRAKKPPREF